MAMKMAGMPMKANELNQSTLANYGDEWIGVTYSSQTVGTHPAGYAGCGPNSDHRSSARDRVYRDSA